MNKFEKAYKLVDFDLGCLKNCNVCEEKGVLFLPGELEHLSKKLSIGKFMSKHIFGNYRFFGLSKKDKHCPFYKFGKCIKRDARPLDCRSYPIVPILKDNRLSIKLDKRCPLVKKRKTNKVFIKNALKAWRIVKPPKWWLRMYSIKI